MALKSRHIKEDALWLKWPLILLFLVVCGFAGVLLTANSFSSGVQRQEQIAVGNLDLLLGQVQAIADSERIIVENIENFNAMVANTILDEEDRVAMLEEIASIRNKHRLFPINVEISEQQRTLLEYNAAIEFPDEEISVRATLISISLPLLHEGDLTNFLADFLQTGRLIVTSRCSINTLAVAEEDKFSIVPHQLANCDFYWFTFKREPFTSV